MARRGCCRKRRARPFIKRALEAGINFFDTADMYSRGVSEEILGRAMRDFATRDDVVIATKVLLPDERRSERSRALAQAHPVGDRRARCGGSAPTTSTSTRSIAGIRRRRSRRRCRRCTTSCAPGRRATSARRAWRPGSSRKALYLADRHGWTRFVSMQNHYNLVYREEEREMLPLCREEGIGVIPWSPLARGFLAGNRRGADKGETERARRPTTSPTSCTTRDSDFRIVDRVVEVATRRGVTPAQIALAWILHQPGVTAPIVGASKMEQLEQAIAALDIESRVTSEMPRSKSRTSRTRSAGRTPATANPTKLTRHVDIFVHLRFCRSSSKRHSRLEARRTRADNTRRESFASSFLAVSTRKDTTDMGSASSGDAIRSISHWGNTLGQRTGHGGAEENDATNSARSRSTMKPSARGCRRTSIARCAAPSRRAKPLDPSVADIDRQRAEGLGGRARRDALHALVPADDRHHRREARLVSRRRPPTAARWRSSAARS